MKRYSFLAVVILSIMTACSVKEIDIQDPDSGTMGVVEGKEIEFTATTGETDPETKSTLIQDGELPNGQPKMITWWSPAEEICIFYGASEGNKFTSTNTELVQKATFRGTLSAFTGQNESGDYNYFWAVYPYDAAVSCDGESVVAILADEQEAFAGSFANKTNITIAKSPGLSLGFYNVCSFLRFTVEKEGVIAATFRGNNNEDVAGKFRVSMGTDGKPTAPEVIEGEKQITLRRPNDEPFVVGTSYYFVLLPQTFENGFTVQFDTADETGSRVITVSAPFIRNNINYGNTAFDHNIEYEPRFIDCPDMPLCFEAIEAGTMYISGLKGERTLQIKKNNANWSNYSGSISVEPGDKVYFKGDNCLEYNDDYDLDVNFNINFRGYMYGNVMSMVDADNYSTLTTLPDSFSGCRLFYDSKILSHPRYQLMLPATALKRFCYAEMFCGCEELTRAPKLPATTLSTECYYQMFHGCRSLTIAPDLPATTLAESCYAGMFMNCTNLRTAPELPAISLAKSCYENMFVSCISLNKSPYLPALKLEQASYYHMFYGCSNLNDVTIMATDITASSCMTKWVHGVSGIGTITKNAFATWTTVGEDGSPSSWTIEMDYPYVDLGLSVLWSPYNLGATTLSEPGNYYAWGEIVPKNSYKWGTYKWGNIGSFTKYNNNTSYGVVDNVNTLEANDDAARYLWGEPWRIPTRDDCEELKSRCTLYPISGVGWSVLGPNGNYIIIPPHTAQDDTGTYSYISLSRLFWSSTIYDSDCRYAYLYSVDTYRIDWEAFDRYVGLPIRPVRNIK